MPGIHEVTASKRLWVPQASAPSTPAADQVAMWVDDDFVLHWIDENGATRSPADRPVEANAASGTYTLVAADAGKYLRFTDASAVAITVPTNASVAYPVGTVVELHAAGAGGLTIAGDTGVTVNGADTVAEDQTARLVKVATDTWEASVAVTSGASAPAASTTGKAARVTKDDGNITANNTSWTDLGVTDITLQDVTAGEMIVVGFHAAVGSESTDLFLDCATIVSASPVNYISGSDGSGVWNGVPTWSAEYGALFLSRGSMVDYELQAGDIDGGNVTLRLRYRTGSAANRTVQANTARRLIFSARALG